MSAFFVVVGGLGAAVVWLGLTGAAFQEAPRLWRLLQRRRLGYEDALVYGLMLALFGVVGALLVETLKMVFAGSGL